MSNGKYQESKWDEILSVAARTQSLIDGLVLVGGTASAIHASHRLSNDADHVAVDLRERFDEVLADLESVSGWKTARIRRPVLILGSLDGIETGIRQLIRSEPLETEEADIGGLTLRIPTLAETLRIKGVLILKRNATRDYLDFAALASEMDDSALGRALAPMNRLYQQPNDETPMQQLQVQLATPLPYDLEAVNLGEYKQLTTWWQDWVNVETACERVAFRIADIDNGPSHSIRH